MEKMVLPSGSITPASVESSHEKLRRPGAVMRYPKLPADMFGKPKLPTEEYSITFGSHARENWRVVMSLNPLTVTGMVNDVPCPTTSLPTAINAACEFVTKEIRASDTARSNLLHWLLAVLPSRVIRSGNGLPKALCRSEEHTSELQSLR